MRILTTAAFVTAVAVTVASAQQTQRVRGMIEKVDRNTLQIKSSSGKCPVAVSLADNAVVVGVLKASVADIKEGSYIGSGALPQADGTQKAVEVPERSDRSLSATPP
jgi:ABC-type transporter MlaC component